MSLQATKPITAEELFEMSDIGRCELIRGEIIHMAPSGAEHGDIAGELFGLIWSFVRQHKPGKVYAAETGFKISHDPDTVRAPDVAFVRKDRVPAKYRRGFFDGAPDLAVEVVSPGDTHSELAAKVDKWLAAGTVSVWVVDPATRSIEIYHNSGEVLRFRVGETLTDDAILPGFKLPLNELFEAT